MNDPTILFSNAVPVSWQPYLILCRWVWCHMTAIQLTLAINCICTSFRMTT